MSAVQILLNQMTIACQLINLHCSECLGGDYCVEIYVYTKIGFSNLNKDKDVLDIVVTDRGEQKIFTGVVHAFFQQDSFYQIKLIPRFSLLKSCFSRRTFVCQTPLQIVQQVMQCYSQLEIDFAKLNKKYATLAYEVQYGESDYDFVKRILSENGISYYYKNARMILYDDVSGYHPYNNNPLGIMLWRRQAQYGSEAMQVLYHGVHAVRLRDPHYHLINNDEIVSPQPPYFINQKLHYAFERAQQQSEVIFAHSDHCDLSVGVSFLYRKHFVISEIYHLLYFEKGQMCYSNQFYCHQASHMMHLPAYKIPSQNNPLYAKVIAIAPGRLLRAAIAYSWDQNIKMSPMLPVRQYWSGDGYGAQFMPALHETVLVAYINGDMRSPLIMAKYQHASVLSLGTHDHYLKCSQDGIFFKTAGCYQVQACQAITLRSNGDIYFNAHDDVVSMLQSNHKLQLSGKISVIFQVGQSFLKIEAGKMTLNSAMIELNPEC